MLRADLFLRFFESSIGVTVNHRSHYSVIIKDKKNYLEHSIPAAPVAPPGHQVPPEALAAHAAWVKGQKEVAELKALYSKQAEQELLQTVREFHTCKQEEGQSVSSHVLKMKGYIDNLERLGCGTHICITTQGLRGSKKLKTGVLSLYVGDGHRAAVEAIGTYHLDLPSRLVIVLNNCHYAPSITEGVISVFRLFDDGFINRFDDNNVISVSKNNLVYFMAVLRDGIFEIDMSCSNTNDSSIWQENHIHIKWKGLKIYFEYMSQEFLDHLKEHGIIAHRTPPYTPQNNEVSERRNRTLLNMVRSMTSQTTLPKSFWDYALETAARILNMVPTKKVDKTLYEIWHGQAPKLSYLKVWGCEAFVKRDTLTKPDKRDPRSFKCIFVGYLKETIGYSFYSPSENKVFVNRNAEFFESKLLDLKASGSVEDLELIQESDTNPSVDTSLNHEEDDQDIDEPQSDINPIPALLDPESKKWLDAMNVGMQSMKDNDVWVLVELPPNARTVGSKWLFKKKTNMDGAIYIFKAHLVAKGFTQTYKVDYEETFSPVVDIRAIRILIAIAAYYDYEIWQMDVKTTFLNGYLSEEVYMEQPEGFVNPRYSNHKFGFTQNPDEPCVYLKASGSYIAILILYVDDILIMGNNIPMLQDVKSYLGRSFDMKDLGDAAYILGIKIYRDRSKQLIGLCQKAYIEKILKRYYMENSKRGTIPMQEMLKLSKSQGASTPAEKQRMQNIPYASAVGSIMYAARCTCPDIAFAHNMTSRFQQNPDADKSKVADWICVHSKWRCC
nr:retrotransposon protein, putative, Ty1-copia subclass [Tanacetum cinerariifolium]